MSRIIADRVMETSTVTGTGSATVAGAVPGFQAFSAVCATGDTFDYVIFGVDGAGVPTGEWESGRGTYPSANTVARTTVLDGSAGAGTPVSFSAGTKNVMATTVAQTNKAIAPYAPWTVPVIADFTAVNTGALVATDRTDGIEVYNPATDSFAFRGWTKASGSATFDLYARLQPTLVGAGNNSRLGLVIANTTSTKKVMVGPFSDTTGSFQLKLTRWTGTGFTSETPLLGGRTSFMDTKWMRLGVDATNITVYAGNGYRWSSLLVESLAGFINSSGAVDEVGFGCQADAGSPVIYSLNSFSLTAPVAGGGGA